MESLDVIERTIREYLTKSHNNPLIKPDDLMMADIGISPDSYDDLIEDLSFALDIKSEDDLYVALGRNLASRMYRRWKTGKTLYPPDLTPRQVSSIAEKGLWPKEFHHRRRP